MILLLAFLSFLAACNVYAAVYVCEGEDFASGTKIGWGP